MKKSPPLFDPEMEFPELAAPTTAPAEMEFPELAAPTAESAAHDKKVETSHSVRPIDLTGGVETQEPRQL
jgi:hypothetical protein